MCMQNTAVKETRLSEKNPSEFKYFLLAATKLQYKPKQRSVQSVLQTYLRSRHRLLLFHTLHGQFQPGNSVC